MSDAKLRQIQSLQFVDKSRAEALLLDFIRETFPDLLVKYVTLRPQAVSLNSFNGFLQLENGGELFFKTHVEQDNVIGEYYNAAMLADAGYPVVQPLFSSTNYGQQILIYEVVSDPSVFDIARKLENNFNPDEFTALSTAQSASDKQLFGLYEQTFDYLSAEEAAKQPVHQLFYHRLTGGRLENFYGTEQLIDLPNGQFKASQIRKINWQINGSLYTDSIDDIIERSIQHLNPRQDTVTIVGHGDAHNGNVFYNADNGQLTYFDPAFAGKHHPLLDLTKPLFHNVFAMWLYFPNEEAEKLSIDIEAKDNTWVITHNYALNSVRRMFIESKVEHCLIPILEHMKSKNALRDDWRAFLKSSLFCCPFLTLNLRNFPPKIALLGLTMAVQMGAESQQESSIIDQILDDVERRIS